jgi:PAS domain S-box-containing protein
MKKPLSQLIQRLDFFASAFSEISSLTVMAHAVEEILEEMFDTRYSGLYLYNRDEGGMKFLFQKGLTSGAVPESRYKEMELQADRAFQSKNTIYIPDILIYDKSNVVSLEFPLILRSQLYLPVMNGNRAVGAYYISDTKPGAYNEEAVAMLSLTLRLAGTAFGNILKMNQEKSAGEQTLSFSIVPDEDPNPVMRISRDEILLEANHASREWLSYHGLKVGQKVNTVFSALIARAIETGKTVEQEITDGRRIYSFLFTPVEGTGYLDVYGSDISKGRNLENELEKMAMIARETGNAVIFATHTGKIDWVNEAFTRITGYTLDEIKGKTPGDFLQGEDTDPQTVALLEKAIQNKKAIEVDIVNYSKSHQKYWVKLQIQPVFSISGELENFISIQKVITKEKEQEQELIHTTTLQKAILNSSAIAIISTDLNGIIQSFNPAATAMLGYQPDEVIGKKTPHLFHDETEIRNRQRDKMDLDFNSLRVFKISATANPDSISTEVDEFTFIRKDGSRFPVSLTVTALRGEHDQVNGFLAMAEDITQRKEQVDALQIANLRFRLLISSMHAGVMVEDDHRKVVLVNQRFCDLFSIPIPPEQLIGIDCHETAQASKILFDDPETFIRDIDNTLAFQQVVTNYEISMTSGTTLERDFIPIEDLGNKNRGILWIYRNITNRKENEKELLRQSQILSGTATAMNFMLTQPDHDQAIQKALEAIGIGSGVDRVYLFENVEDEFTGEAFFNQRYEWAAAGVAPQIDNQELQNIPFSEEFPLWFKSFKSGKTISGLVKDFQPRERQMLEEQDIVSIIMVPVFVKNRLWGMVGFDDCKKGIQWSTNESSILTALAASIGGHISRRIIEDELIDARHIAEYATKTKSEFLATMSHEIRTPMNGVIGMTSLLMQTPLTSDQRDYTETIKISGELLLSLINDILDFSKIESGKMTLEEHSIDLIMAIEDVMDLMATAAIKKNLGLYYQVDPRIPRRITGDLTRLRQILVNLTGNAIKFTTKGEVVIRVKQIETQGNVSTLEFSVKDTGIGIPEDKIDRLFKPFSQVDASTTRKYGGTGLGLAICSTLVKLMNGDIRVNSEADRGSEFLFTVKVLYNLNDAQAGKPFPYPRILKRKRILLVDSNPVSSDILGNLFENMEMDTLVVNSAKQALTVLHENRDLDIIVIDNALPDMDYNVLASHFHKTQKYSAVPIILTTQPSSAENDNSNKGPFQARINKPLKHSQLVSAVINLLSNCKKSQSHDIVRQKKFLTINEKHPLSILVAEDNTINQKLIKSLFNMLGYTIQLAANGYEAIDTLNRMEIDIVFMDIQMPEMDGMEATRQIIAQWADSRPLIVAMTANALSSDKDKCLAQGMDDYISKPLTIDQVSAGIEKWASIISKRRKTNPDQ